MRSTACSGPTGRARPGKTTTIKMICGLIAPDKGSVSVDGRSVERDLTVRMLIGYVPQDVALYPDLTARENLTFLGRLSRLRGRELSARVDEALELTDLQSRGGDRVDSFSGGMKRRLNVAGGLLHRPELLVLDEPTVGVDPQSRHAILERVGELRRRSMAVVYTTHHMEGGRAGLRPGGDHRPRAPHRRVIVGATVRGFSTWKVGVVDLGAGRTGRSWSSQWSEPRASPSARTRTPRR